MLAENGWEVLLVDGSCISGVLRAAGEGAVFRWRRTAARELAAAVDL